MATDTKKPRKVGDPPPADGADLSNLGNEDPDKGTDVGFTSPELKDKTPEQIEELFRMSQQIVEGHKRKLDVADQKITALETAPPPAPVPPAGEKKTFFDDPDAKLDGAFERLAKRMDDQMSTIRDEVRGARSELAAVGVFDDLRAEFPDWDEVYPYVKFILESKDPPFPNPNEKELLRTLYYTAVGMMTKKGITTAEPPKTPAGGDPPPTGAAPPQHRSSPPPPPPKREEEGKGVTWDDLDESEKVLCKFYEQTPAEFREFAAIGAEDVIGSTIGQEKKD